ncbi:YhdH/YhfP family quinone oxidoreductase [Oceaniserpentilla sp. 4NH20-0058]|uniref:YhdH/YhfP family quinone oxidoreductase n=1 Tax=Oceaniserpentilla sp. 4NH20-0058 TaxID=3127660 RepID=UPI0031050F08
MKYSALVVTENDREFSAAIESLDTSDLPDGEILIKVSYSSVNFKDALSFSGNKGVTRSYPHTPGIDAVGTVIESTHSNFKVEDKVIVTGYDLGMNTSGGFGEYIRVPSSWVLHLPENITELDSMAWGTAGITAALCVDKLISNGISKSKPILVSGATGGVGSISIMLLDKLGYYVHALTSKAESSEYLKAIGAKEIHLLSDFIDESKRPILKPLFSAAVDVAGGNVLSSILKTLDYGGSVACCGLVASPEINTSVFPFILRDISLLGVDSVELPLTRKQEIWNKIATNWQLPELIKHCEVINKEQLIDVMGNMLKGQISGRFIVQH